MNKMNLTKQIWLSMGFLCVAILIMGVAGVIKLDFVFDRLEKVAKVNTPVSRALADTNMMHDNIKGNVYAALFYFSQNNQEGLQQAFKDNKDAEKTITDNVEFVSKVDLSAKTKEMISASSAEVDKYVAFSNSIIEKLVNKNQQGIVTDVQKFEEQFGVLEEKLEKLDDAIQAETQLVSGDAAWIETLFLGSAAVIFLLGFGITYYTTRRLHINLKKYTSELDQSSNLVKSISENLSAANVQLSSSATESASSLEETVASLEELSSMISLNTENSKKAFHISEQAKKATDTGDQNIRDLSTAMVAIKSDSKKMEDIVNVIDDISFQTNLLALNAAVEAARAGEQGKGFAVVADAVRSLAQRSSASAKEINQMIKDSIGKIEKGSALASDCNQSLKNISEHVKTFTELSGQIAQASAEQTTGLKQINQAMIQLDSASQENASTAEQVSKSASEANFQSDQMNQVVNELTAFIFGEGTVSAPLASAPKVLKPMSSKEQRSNVVPLKKAVAKKAMDLDMGPEPQNKDIKKVENF